MTYYVNEAGVLIIPVGATEWDAVRSVLDAVADYGLRGFMVEDRRRSRRGPTATRETR